MKKTNITLVLFVFIVTHALAQDSWSLQKCILYAQENNLMVQQMDISIQNAELNLKQNKSARYPNANASTSFGLNLGRTIDPTTNSFDTQTSQFNTFGVNSGMLLYNFGRVQKSIDQSALDVKAAEYDMEQRMQDVALQVAEAYLQVLLIQEQIAIAQNQFDQTKIQLDQTDKLIAVGTLPKNNRLEIEAQLARNEQTVISAENALELSVLNLKQLLSLDPSEPFAIENPDIEIPQDDLKNINLEMLYQEAVTQQPNLQAGEYRIKSAELQEEIAKTTRLPSISIFASLNTNYSSLAQTIDQINFGTEDVPFTADLGGTPVTGNIAFPTTSATFKQIPYFEQVTENIGAGVGISINIPIYDNNISNINRQRAKLNKENLNLQNDLLKQQLKTTLQNAIASAKAGKKSYLAAQKSADASRLSYENVEKRYEIGAANAFELTTARTTLQLAQSEVVRAKYDYIFRLKIVDFYLGRKIELN